MHIHIPDGILPIWLWVIGFLIVVVFLIILLPRLRKEIQKIPLVGMTTAVVLLVMSIPLGLPVHLSLMVFIGLLVGVRWSLIVALIVNIILASFGHGGLTIVGLNTLMLWLQAFFGIYLFRFFIKILRNYFVSASLATFISLFISFLFLIGIVAISTVEPAEFLHHHKELGHLEISLFTFILLSSPVAVFGIIIESIITGVIVQFLKRIKPELIA